jgi:hypothetical protein
MAGNLGSNQLLLFALLFLFSSLHCMKHLRNLPVRAFITLLPPNLVRVTAAARLVHRMRKWPQ